jgi:microcystin-dependent protein
MSSGFNIRNNNQFSFSDLTANLKFIDTIELGYQPDKTNSGAHSIAIGTETGINNQGTFGIAIGLQAAQYNQGVKAISIGVRAGQNNEELGQNNLPEQETIEDQLIKIINDFNNKLYNTYIPVESKQNDISSSNMISIGEQAGQNQQKSFAIAIGNAAGQNNQGSNAIAIGTNAGFTNQGSNAIALGTATGQNNQGANNIAIGNAAGQNNQGSNAIAIGTNAGVNNQHANSIILNASGDLLNTNTSGLFIKPINIDNSNQVLSYNSNTSEITIEPNPIQIGTFKYSVRTSDHTGGWLLCDGRTLSINQYPLLFSVMGYNFGGSGNFFQLPDARSRLAGVIGQGIGLSNRTIGEKVGSENLVLTIDQIPNHSHTIIDTGHTHTFTNPTERQNNDVFIESPFPAASSSFYNFNTTTSTTGITINNAGGGLGYDIMQPILYIGSLFVYAD